MDAVIWTFVLVVGAWASAVAGPAIAEIRRLADSDRRAAAAMNNAVLTMPKPTAAGLSWPTLAVTGDVACAGSQSAMQDAGQRDSVAPGGCGAVAGGYRDRAIYGGTVIQVVTQTTHNAPSSLYSSAPGNGSAVGG